jgi:hypothetical protein
MTHNGIETSINYVREMRGEGICRFGRKILTVEWGSTFCHVRNLQVSYIYICSLLCVILYRALTHVSFLSKSPIKQMLIDFMRILI